MDIVVGEGVEEAKVGFVDDKVAVGTYFVVDNVVLVVVVE